MAPKQSTRREHLAIVEEAGYKRISVLAVIAGTLTGYGAFALLAALVGAVFSAANVDTDFTTNDWTSTGAAGGLATAVVLFAAYLFGGYVAGRMARRAGVLHGIAVFVLGLVAGGVIGAVVKGVGDDADVERNLRSIGVPTGTDAWGNVAVATAITALVLMAAGALLGGLLGERWHTKLARRAADPDYGPEHESRQRVAEAGDRRNETLASDRPVQRDVRTTRGRDDDVDLSADAQPVRPTVGSTAIDGSDSRDGEARR